MDYKAINNAIIAYEALTPEEVQKQIIPKKHILRRTKQ